IASDNGGVNMGNGSELDSGTANVALQAHDDIRVSKITTTGPAAVAITTSNGNIVDDVTPNTRIVANSVSLTATTGKIGNFDTLSPGQEIDTDTPTLTMSSAHGANVSNVGALTVTSIGAGDGDVHLTTGGTATLGNVTTTGDAFIT